MGDNCTLMAGAKIIGDVSIGNNVRIGAQAVVVKDIPSNMVVAGVPARIIREDQNCAMERKDYLSYVEFSKRKK